MSANPRILVLTLSFGAGHVRAAQSVVAELHKQLPDADLRLVDALENCSLVFRAFYVWTYWAMIRYAPRIWNRFFHARLARRDEQTAPVWMWRRGCRKVFAEIENFQPEAIIAAEVGACEIAVIARRANMTNAQIVNVITDYEAEPIWVKPEIAAFAVPNQKVAEQLQSWGANENKIKICGIPLDESFSAPQDAERVKKQFVLDEKPIVLLMGGGMGPTRMDEVAARLLKDGKNINIVALAGRDERARRELEKLRNSATVRLTVPSWTNKVAALMRSAAILVTKPGGLTLSEAAACGVPMVFFDAIPGPEESNAARFAASGAGISTRGSNETAAAVLRLLNEKDERRAMAENARKLAQPDAAKEIAGLILKEIEAAPEIEKVRVMSKKLSNSRKIYSVWRRLKRRKRAFEG